MGRGWSYIGVLPISLLLEAFGWRTAALVSALVFCAVSIPAALVLRDRPEPYGYLPDGDPLPDNVRTMAPAERRRVDVPGYTVSEAMHTRAFWMILVNMAIYGFVTQTFQVHFLSSLRFAGFEVHVAGDGATALNLATAHEPDLVVLDVMLPDMDGFTVTRKLRDTGRQLPIVFVTARDSVDDKIKGLTVGGDDYVTKPFSLEEVVARIRAVLRRTRGDADEDRHVLAFEDLELDEDSHEVRRAGRVIETSPTEFKLLRYLMLNPNRVLSKAQILDHVWDYDFRGESGIVESYISYLRRKIDTEGLPPLIHTKRGVGYVLRMPPAA